MAAIAKPARRMWPQLQPVQTLYCLVNQFVPQRVGNQVCSCSVVLESHEIRSVPVPTGPILGVFCRELYPLHPHLGARPHAPAVLAGLSREAPPRLIVSLCAAAAPLRAFASARVPRPRQHCPAFFLVIPHFATREMKAQFAAVSISQRAATPCCRQPGSWWAHVRAADALALCLLDPLCHLAPRCRTLCLLFFFVMRGGNILL